MTPSSFAREAVVSAREASHSWHFDEDSAFSVAFPPPRREPTTIVGGTKPDHSHGPNLTETLAAIDRLNGKLHAFVAVDEDPMGGGPLCSFKDVIHVNGFPTLAGSRAYEPVIIGEGTAVRRLRAAGYRFVGKTETHEFALGVTSPQCRNPHDSTRLAGGSSGGSAVAVASGMGHVSIGTDTRASIRVPASLCGVVGFKPTLGKIPSDGIVQLSWTMDHLAVLASTVGDAALAMDVMSGAEDSSSYGGDVQGLRFGFPASVMEACEPDVIDALELSIKSLGNVGVEVMEVPRPNLEDLDQCNAAGMLVSRAEATTWHRHRGTDLDLCIPEVRDQLLAARDIAASEYLSAQRLRQRLANEMLSLADQHQLAGWIMPTTPCSAPLVADYEQYLFRLSLMAIPWSFMGYPSLSLPVPTPVLPVGLQLVAAPWDDHVVVALGSALERYWAG